QVLGVLQVSRRGKCCFAGIASFSLRSLATAETCFRRFCVSNDNRLEAGFWYQWVRLPKGDNLEQVDSIYNDLGLPGAVGSTDCGAGALCFSRNEHPQGGGGFHVGCVQGDRVPGGGERHDGHQARLGCKAESGRGAVGDGRQVQPLRSGWHYFVAHGQGVVDRRRGVNIVLCREGNGIDSASSKFKTYVSIEQQG
ncbi:unnamed protein product, partial [Pylaiella littoralis]